MTIGADEYALVQLLTHPLPTSGIAVLRNPEVFLGGVEVMEFQRLYATVVSAAAAFAAFVFDRHPPDLFSPLTDRGDDVGSAICIAPHRLPLHPVHSQPLYRLSYRGISLFNCAVDAGWASDEDSVPVPSQFDKLKLAPALEGAGEGGLVRVLQMAADGDSGRDAGDLEPPRPNELRQVGGGQLAVFVGVGRHDDLVDRLGGQPVQQLVDLQQFRADAIERRDRPQQDVVEAAVGAGLLNREDVLRLLDDAQDGGIARAILTDLAAVRLAQIEAHLAEAQVVLDVGDRLGQLPCLFAGGPQQVKGHPLGGPGADAGELLQRFQQPHQRPGIT